MSHLDVRAAVPDQEVQHLADQVHVLGALGVQLATQEIVVPRARVGSGQTETPRPATKRFQQHADNLWSKADNNIL